jgi:hypothetical protein
MTLNWFMNFKTGLRARVRLSEGHGAEPSAAVVDFQSVRADATVKNVSRGFDREKKTNGRKGHVVVDCLGLLLINPHRRSSVHNNAGLRHAGRYRPRRQKAHNSDHARI